MLLHLQLVRRRRNVIHSFQPVFLKATQRFIHHSSVAQKDFKLTDIGEGIVQVEVLKWFVKPGDTVKEFDKLVEVQSDKATVEITSRFAGRVKSLAMDEGKMAKVGQVLVVFEDDANLAQQTNSIPSAPHANDLVDTHKPKGALPPAPKPPSPPPSSAEENDAMQMATPAVRHLAKENNVNLTRVKGTGRDGRILKSDVLAFLESGGAFPAIETVDNANANQQRDTTNPVTRASKPSAIGASMGIQVVPITGIRREMVKSMTAALKIPHLGYMDDVRVDEAFRVVSGRKDITMLSVLIKAVSLALEDFPEMNSTTDPEVTELRVNHDHHIGIAMDTPRGLMVPVIHQVRDKSVTEVAKELARLKELGTAGKLGMSELSGSTFTLSNIGSVGGTYASPVIVPPQVAIGAFGRAKRVPVFENSKSLTVEEARIMPVSWAADHRVLDGATVARFSNRFKQLVENPIEMLLRMK